MPLFYLTVFLIGLVLVVYAMIRGVERVGSGQSPELDALGRPIGAARMSLAAPRLGVFATVFGITGYLMSRYADVAVLVQAAIAIVAALLGTIVATRAVARWARQAAQEDAVDERYLLQGHPALVVTAIAPSAQASEAPRTRRDVIAVMSISLSKRKGHLPFTWQFAAGRWNVTGLTVS